MDKSRGHSCPARDKPPPLLLLNAVAMAVMVAVMVVMVVMVMVMPLRPFDTAAVFAREAMAAANRAAINGTTANGMAAINGTTANGTTANGTTANPTSATGTTANGTTANGTTANPTSATGTTANGTTANGTTANPTSATGTTANGTTANGTTANGAAPSTVRNLTVTGLTNSSMTLAFSSTDDSAGTGTGTGTGYDVELVHVPGWSQPGATVAVRNSTTVKTFIKVTGLLAGTAYAVTVRVNSTAGGVLGEAANLTQITKPSPVVSLASTWTGDSLTARWQPEPTDLNKAHYSYETWTWRVRGGR
ncbi:unnamed protein product [Lampetra fluviatilis]